MKMKAKLIKTIVWCIEHEGKDLGEFVQDGETWNGLICLKNKSGKVIIVIDNAVPQFQDVFSILFGKEHIVEDFTVVSATPSLIHP